MDGRFWKWVAKKKAGRNPRGDFIRDTRDVIEMGANPDEKIIGACNEAKDEYDKLKIEFVKKVISSHSVTSIREGLYDGYIVELEPKEADE